MFLIAVFIVNTQIQPKTFSVLADYGICRLNYCLKSLYRKLVPSFILKRKVKPKALRNDRTGFHKSLFDVVVKNIPAKIVI